jgi:chemotaxis protein MotA
MDLATVVGVIGSFFFVAFGIVTGGGSLMSYVSISSVLITIGGSVFATIAAQPIDSLRKATAVFSIIFNWKKIDPAQTILTLLSFSEKARREGLLALEDDLEEVSDLFLKSGVQLVVDGTEPELVKSIMTAELDSIDNRHGQYRKLADDMAELCPAFGMIGTLIGLIVMMNALGGDASAIGAGMATALLTTLYGAVLANGFFLPAAKKLEMINNQEISMKEIVIEGTLSIQAGDNPRILQQKLTSYFPPEVRKKITEQIGE